MLLDYFYRTRVRSLFTLVTNWLTDSLLFSRLDWCDPCVWRCQLNTCWGCFVLLMFLLRNVLTKVWCRLGSWSFLMSDLSNSFVPFKSPWRECQSFYWQEWNHCFIFIMRRKPFDNWSNFLCPSNDLINIHELSCIHLRNSWSRPQKIQKCPYAVHRRAG